MTYQKAVRYLNSFINYEKKKKFPYNELCLKKIRVILGYLGNPHKKIKAIHVAGTKGKGSTSVFISSILRNAGYKTGLYTSPHLHDFRERITINGRLISKKDLITLVGKLKLTIDKYALRNQDAPTFFEIYTILAFYYFYLKKVDFMVLETGIGGRLDATNVITPLVSVITPISYEHKDKLGGTLTKIAKEKAAIIKRGSIAISAEQPKAARKVIEETASRIKSRLFTVSRDICFYENKFDGKHQYFKVKSAFNVYNNLKTILLGRHQLMNATSAIAAVEALKFKGIIIEPPAIKKGISSTSWAGRLELISRNPFIVLDGAQNKASAEVLKDAVLKFFDYKRLILILGISRDKDIKGICSVLQKISDIIILTKANHPRATPISYLKKFISKSKNKKIHLIEEVENALALAVKEAKKNDLVLVTGSLFVVAQARSVVNVQDE